jgi:hypothetical protein
MLSALLLLSLLATQEPPQKLDVENTKLLVYDAAKGFTFRILKDGKVELTVRGEKTIAAPTTAEFRAKNPEWVRKYDLGRYLGSEAKPLPQDQFEEWWQKLKKGIPDPGPVPGLEAPFDEDLQKLLEEELNKLRRPFRRPEPPPVPDNVPRATPVPGGRELGVKVQDVGETLRDQLSLKENEGVLVTEVKPGSPAEKAGLKEHDILLKLEGRPITDRWQFRADVLPALGKAEFELELLRSGKKSTVKVKPAVRKDE